MFKGNTVWFWLREHYSWKCSTCRLLMEPVKDYSSSLPFATNAAVCWCLTWSSAPESVQQSTAVSPSHQGFEFRVQLCECIGMEWERKAPCLWNPLEERQKKDEFVIWRWQKISISISGSQASVLMINNLYQFIITGYSSVQSYYRHDFSYNFIWRIVLCQKVHRNNVIKNMLYTTQRKHMTNVSLVCCPSITHSTILQKSWGLLSFF